MAPPIILIIVILKNPKMKSIQMILYSYFLINGVVTNKIKEIRLISAKNKLKTYDGPPIIVKSKNKYTRTKLLAIEYCRYIIKNNIKKHIDNITYFNEHKKKDDLADAFLQGVWFINSL